MRLILIFSLLFTQYADTFAQSKKVSLKLVFHEGVNKNKFTVTYDNGLIEQRHVLSKNNKTNEELIETECYTPYLKISIVGLYEEETFDNNEDFYVDAESGRIDFYKNPNRKDNLQYQLKFEGALDDIGQRHHKNAIRKEIDEMVALRKNPLFVTDESLREAYNAKSDMIQKKEWDLIKEHNDEFYYQELFYKKMGIWHGDFTEKEIYDFYLSSFGENFRKSVYGKRIENTIADLELDEGSAAPRFVQKDLNGKLIDLKNYRDKYVLIDFWATWCKPCIQKLPTIQAIAGKYKNKGLITIMISSDSDEVEWKSFIESHSPNLIHVRDIEDSIGGAWRTNYIPQTFLIDKEGKIIYSAKASNDDSLEKLKQILEKI